MPNSFINPEDNRDRPDSSASFDGKIDLPAGVEQILTDPQIPLADKFDILLPRFDNCPALYNQDASNEFVTFETDSPITAAAKFAQKAIYYSFLVSGSLEILAAASLESLNLLSKIQKFNLAHLEIEIPIKHQTVYLVAALGLFSLASAYCLDPSRENN